MEGKVIILFDGECLLCIGWVQWLIKKDKKEILRFCPLQSDSGQKIIHQFPSTIQHLDTIILIEGTKCYVKSSAALRITRHLPFPYSLLFFGVSIPKFIRNWIYDLVAKNRYRWFGKKDQCMIPDEKLKQRFLF